MQIRLKGGGIKGKEKRRNGGKFEEVRFWDDVALGVIYRGLDGEA